MPYKALKGPTRPSRALCGSCSPCKVFKGIVSLLQAPKHRQLCQRTQACARLSERCLAVFARRRESGPLRHRRRNWLDPATLRLALKNKNTHQNKTLQLASGPWCLIDQVRLLIGGVEVERIGGPRYGRQHELCRHLLMPSVWNVESTNEDGQEYNAGSYPQVQPKVTSPGQYLSLNLTPLLGILNAQKYPGEARVPGTW